MYFLLRRILLMVLVYQTFEPLPVGMPSRSSPALILSMLYSGVLYTCFFIGSMVR